MAADQISTAYLPPLLEDSEPKNISLLTTIVARVRKVSSPSGHIDAQPRRTQD